MTNNSEITALLEAMNLNNAYVNSGRFGSTYAGYEVTETRKKYHLLNSILTNGQRSGLWLIDRETLVAYKSTGYGKTNGRKIGTVASLTAHYTAANTHWATEGAEPKFQSIPANIF